MASFPVKPPQPPVAFENGSGFKPPKNPPPAKSPTLEAAKPKAPPQGQPKPKGDGKRDPDSGGVVFTTGTEGKKARRLILVSRILTAWRQDPENRNTAPPQDPEKGAAPKMAAR